MTEREYLVSLGLAKAGARGRFSREAHAALEKAKSEGKTFDDSKPAQTSEMPKAVAKHLSFLGQPPKVDKPKSSPKPGQYDVKAVRAWAEDKGLIGKGQRGRLPGNIIHQYVTENGAAQPKPVRKATPAPVRTRDENYAWHLKTGDASVGQTDVRMQFGDCSECRQRIGYCTCPAPIGPKWLGSPVLSLTKP